MPLTPSVTANVLAAWARIPSGARAGNDDPTGATAPLLPPCSRSFFSLPDTGSPIMNRKQVRTEW